MIKIKLFKYIFMKELVGLKVQSVAYKVGIFFLSQAHNPTLTYFLYIKNDIYVVYYILIGQSLNFIQNFLSISRTQLLL